MLLLLFSLTGRIELNQKYTFYKNIYLDLFANCSDFIEESISIGPESIIIKNDIFSNIMWRSESIYITVSLLSPFPF